MKPKVKPLSPAELVQLQEAASGMLAPESARDHYLSVETIKTHRKHVLSKLGARNMTEAVAIGFRLKILS